MSDIAATAAAVQAIREGIDGVRFTVYEAHLRGRECDDPGCDRCHPPEAARLPAIVASRAADAIDRYMEQHGRAPPHGWKPGR